MNRPEGWHKAPGSRRFHYYYGQASVCEQYRLPSLPTFETVPPPESERCMRCRAVEAHLAAERAKLAEWNRTAQLKRDAGGAL